MKIFGSIDIQIFPVTGRNNPGKRFVYGAWVGTENFYQALLKYGVFDEYHFFVDSKLGAHVLKKKLLDFSFKLNRIKIIHVKELPLCLRKIKYTVFFTVEPNLSKLAYLRLKFAKEYFPICGIAFQTISYSESLKNIFFDNLISDLQSFDSIICTSKAVYRAIQNLHRLVSSSFKKGMGASLKYRGRLGLLPFGIDAQDYAKVNKLAARERLGLSKDKVIILYFGRFSLYDKADLYPLLVAFKEILPNKRNAILLLAGVDAQDRYGTKLKNIAKDMGLLSNIKFIFGNCLKEKSLLYSASDIFVSPSDSIQESFGITVLEAMASGLAVVASDWNGYKNLVIHNKTGFRVPTYWANCNIDIASFYRVFNFWQRDHLYLAQSVCVDTQKLTEYLSILVKNKGLRLKFGQNARDRVIEKYDWKILIPAYEKLWQGLSKLAKGRKIKTNKNGLFAPKYFECFSHYPTRFLNAETKITIDKDGLLFLKTKRLPFKIQEEIQDIISVRTIFLILTFLLEKNTATIGQIENHTQKVFKTISSGIVRYHIMWLLKKGLLRL